MNLVILNGRKMKSKIIAHRYLAQKLSFPDYYGANLDALWDILSTISEPIEIVVLETTQIKNNLGDYGLALIKLLEEAATANDFLTLKIDSF